MSRTEDWLSRQVLTDLYPRKEDPFKPGAGNVPFNAPGPSQFTVQELQQSGDPYQEVLTTPGQRPIVYQRATNFQVVLAAGASQPLQPGPFQCDTIVLDVLSTAANSAFFGYGSGINATNGLEIRAGLPIVISPDNTREQWEIQRLLEGILAILATNAGLPSLSTYRAPRVVFNANEYYLFALAATTVQVMLFSVPELQ